ALFGGLAPSLTPLWSSRNVAEELRRAGLDPKTAGPVAYVGYAEPSAVFLDGARTEINASPKGGADAIAAGHAVVVDSRQDTAFRFALAAKGVQAEPVATKKGYNYSKGRAITLTIYRPAGRWREPSPERGRIITALLQIRRGRLGGKAADGFLERQHLLGVGAQAAQRHRSVLRLLAADDGDHRDLGQRVFADLVVDLLVAQVGLDAQAG